MTSSLVLPSPSASREYIADWLELRALQLKTRGVSIREVIRDLKIGGVVDALDDYDDGVDVDEDDETAGEPIVDDAFLELYERKVASGDAYPFEVTKTKIQLREEEECGVYAFLALLARYGERAGPAKTNGAKIFEDVCAKAIESYLGGAHTDVKSYAFGFPRRTLPKSFCAAVDELCSLMREGTKARGNQPTSKKKKDAKLDIVAWREFADKRHGKLIAFGQCATGADWQEKRNELPKPGTWCELYMNDQPYFEPIRMFLIPHRIESDDWEETCRIGGLFFDRCRIAYHSLNLDPETARACNRWACHVLQERLRK